LQSAPLDQASCPALRSSGVIQRFSPHLFKYTLLTALEVWTERTRWSGRDGADATHRRHYTCFRHKECCRESRLLPEMGFRQNQAFVKTVKLSLGGYGNTGHPIRGKNKFNRAFKVAWFSRLLFSHLRVAQKTLVLQKKCLKG